jgi:sec-independent protein translocase protein TatA
MNTILLFGMPGGAELFFIVLVIIMLFGSKKIPELARGLGKGIREIKNATGDIQKEIREGARDINNIKDKVNVEKQVKDLIKEDKEQKEEAKVEPVKTEEVKEETVPASQTVKRRSPYEKENSQESQENA